MTREDDHAEDTLRSPEAAADLTDPGPAASEVYVEPQALPKASDHKTLEVDTVKLSEEIDPRKRPTELKLGRVRRRPADESSDSADTPSTPPEGVEAPAIVSDGARPGRWLAGAAALLLLCVAAFVVARGLRARLAQRSVASAPAVALSVTTTSKPPAPTHAATPPWAIKPAAAAASAVVPPSASTALVAPLVSAPELPQKAAGAPRSAKPASARAPSAPDSKPKHPIY